MFKVAQELGVIEKDPDFVNPYKEETIMVSNYSVMVKKI